MIPTATEPGMARASQGTQSALQAIDRSRIFLQQRLLPDLAAAERRVASLMSDRTAYIDLARELRRRRDSIAAARDEPSTSTSTAPLGFGIHIPVEIKLDAPVIINLGLAQSSSTGMGLAEQTHGLTGSGDDEEVHSLAETSSENTGPARGDAGLYAELTVAEALDFIQKKVPILDKKIALAQEKVAAVQGHVELTTRSIEQLAALQGKQGASFLDFLSTQTT